MGIPAGNDANAEHALAIRTTVAVIAGGASLLGPDAGAAATALTPAAEAVTTRLINSISQRRIRHATQTLEDAAEAAGETIEQFTEKAVADEQRQELLVRTLTIAQDTALRDKRRALARALAAGIKDDTAKIDDELLFIRAVADIDTPHIRLLSLIASEHNDITTLRKRTRRGCWPLKEILERAPGLAGAVVPLIATLEAHGLIRLESTLSPGKWGNPPPYEVYDFTDAGLALLDRLSGEDSG